jgi:hypothetical protein
MDEKLPRKAFDLKAFKRWKLIQIVAILPLSMTVVLMIYFRESPELFVVSFFLVLIIGVLMPQISGDYILSHIVLREEFRKEIRFLEGEVQKLRRDLQVGISDKESPPFKVMK